MGFAFASRHVAESIGRRTGFPFVAAEQEPMGDIQPIRRVVTGNDAQGRSRVLFDSAAPNVNPGAVVRGTCMTDIWVYHQSPAPIAVERDDVKLPINIETPAAIAHLCSGTSHARPTDMA